MASRRRTLSFSPGAIGAALIAGFVLACLLALVAPPLVRAQDADLRQRVTDDIGVLDDTGAIEDALDELEDEHDVQLWVYFVETTGSLSVTDFVDELAENNSFGGNDALLVVAIDDRSDSLWVGNSLDDISNSEIDRLLTQELEPRLADGDFDDAVIALASGLGDAASGTLGQTPATPSSGGGTSSGDSGGSGSGTAVAWFFGGIAAMFAVLGGVWFAIRRAKVGRREAAHREVVETLDQRANGLLLAVDDELKDAEQEIGFAEAQFGEVEVESFRTAHEGAHAELQQAFAARQRLDDEHPETTAEREVLLNQVIAHAEAARAVLAPQSAHIEELRAIERNAPKLLAALPAQLDQAEARLAAAEPAYAKLQAYAESVWNGLDGNIIEARKRLAFARETVAAGLRAVESGDAREAGTKTRGAQVALVEAITLVEAIEHQVSAVQHAIASFPAELAAAAADISAARLAVEEHDLPGGGEAVARADSLLDAARKEGQNERPDPISALKHAQEANAAADAVLEQVREQDEQTRRQFAAYQTTFQRAQSTYRQASDYVLGRRPGIGGEARTRLAEAERRLDSARRLEYTDLPQAFADAEAADRLARDAYRIAQQDFRDYNGPGSSGGYGGSGGGDAIGSVLGGMLGGILMGGMRGGGPGFGGTSWGGYSSGRRSSGGSRGSSGGRSRGSSFRTPSGGGGRSRGGRW